MDANIYTDLDSFYDTRWPISASIGLSNAMKSLIDGYHGMTYYNRIADRSKYIDYEEYLEAYSKRDSTILPACGLTGIVALLASLIIRTPEESKVVGKGLKPGLIINTYPYVLSEDLEQRIMSDLLAVMGLPLGTYIETIHIDPNLISLNWLEDRSITTIVAYDGDSILGSLLNQHGLVDNPRPNLSIIAPALLRGEVKDLIEALSPNEYGLGPFRNVELSLSRVIDVNFVNSDIFNARIYEIKD